MLVSLGIYFFIGGFINCFGRFYIPFGPELDLSLFCVVCVVYFSYLSCLYSKFSCTVQFYFTCVIVQVNLNLNSNSVQDSNEPGNDTYVTRIRIVVQERFEINNRSYAIDSVIKLIIIIFSK